MHIGFAFLTEMDGSQGKEFVMTVCCMSCAIDSFWLYNKVSYMIPKIDTKLKHMKLPILLFDQWLNAIIFSSITKCSIDISVICGFNRNRYLNLCEVENENSSYRNILHQSRQ